MNVTTSAWIAIVTSALVAVLSILNHQGLIDGVIVDIISNAATMIISILGGAGVSALVGQRAGRIAGLKAAGLKDYD